MPWGGEKRATCKACGKPRKPGEIFSARGMHMDCGDVRRTANAIQLHQHNGPFFDHWRKRCLASFGVTVLDAPANSAHTAGE